MANNKGIRPIRILSLWVGILFYCQPHRTLAIATSVKFLSSLQKGAWVKFLPFSNYPYHVEAIAANSAFSGKSHMVP
jgi:hypothetical protein